MGTPPDLLWKVVFILLLLLPAASGLPIPGLQHGLGHLVRRGLVSPSNEELLHNTIAFAVPAYFAFALRMCNRFFITKKFHKEDWMMCATMFFYTSLMALINVSARFATNLYPPEQQASIMADPSDVKNRIIGSKIVIALEQCMIASTWGVKLCIWVFEMRLFRQLPQYERPMWFVFWFIWVGFGVIQIVYYGVFCRPFNGYWAMPIRKNQIECATYHNYSIVQMVFNISSDFMLIIVPLPLIWQARVPKKSKVLLVFLFCMAGFTILAAILNKYYNFKSPMTTVYQLWYVREASVAVIVGNLICTYQLWQRLFSLKSFNGQNHDIADEQPMPRMLNSRNPIRRVMDYLTPAGDTFRSYHDHTQATQSRLNGGDDSTMTGDTFEGKDKNDKGKPRPVTQISTNYMMTLSRDGEGDARAAIAFREKEGIE